MKQHAPLSTSQDRHRVVTVVAIYRSTGRESCCVTVVVVVVAGAERRGGRFAKA